MLVARGAVAGRGAPPRPGRIRYKNPAGKATVADLTRAYGDLMEALRAEPPEIVRPAPVEVTVEERSSQLIARLQQEVRLQFSALFSGENQSRRFVVVTFLAVLEMIRQGMVIAEQSDPFG